MHVYLSHDVYAFWALYNTIQTMLVSNGPLADKERKYITLESKAAKNYKFEFPSHDLAFQVR
jgi:hypothetical protein